ncbi:histidine phosphatase family protein [Virgibacillus sp. C22-A2]|uniref:Histidine phosphatase family protein n=1 Tax=Virgibacillus tibetensis TaxID=3042313 RepID=A0ABU6KCH9_9BACI|nr:histidine phosphatase family protein [Virgibacillus sp. C22-A2]
MKNIYLVRHCSAYGQHKDSPLTNTGIRQAQHVSRFFSKQDIKVDKIISSPYLRAIESIKPFAQKLEMDIEIDVRLHERILSEEPIDDWLEVLDRSFQEPDFFLPGGESANEAVQRANHVLEMIYTDDSITNVIVVSHGNLLALLLKQHDNNFGFEQWKALRSPDVYLLSQQKGNSKIECVWE